MNIGFENDPVFKAVNFYKNNSSSLDNLVLATAEYMAGNTTGRSPFSMYAHTATLGFAAFARLEQSQFYDLMKPDSVIIFDAADGLVQDRTSGRTKTGAFYLGEEVADYIIGRDGHDYIEGFGGNDNLKGGRGNDSIRGGDGNDTIEGEIGNDTLFGDDGDDILIGGAGADNLFGDAGDDTFVISGSDGVSDKFYGGSGADKILVAGTTAPSRSQVSAQLRPPSRFGKATATRFLARANPISSISADWMRSAACSMSTAERATTRSQGRILPTICAAAPTMTRLMAVAAAITSTAAPATISSTVAMATTC